MVILKPVIWICHVYKDLIIKFFRLIFMLALGLFNFVNSRSCDRIKERYKLISPFYSTNEQRDQKLQSKNSRSNKNGHLKEELVENEEKIKSSKDKVNVNLNIERESEKERLGLETQTSDTTCITPISTQHSIISFEPQEHSKLQEDLKKFTFKNQSSLNPLKQMVVPADKTKNSQEEISNLLSQNSLENNFLDYVITQRRKAYQIVKAFMKLKIYRKNIKVYYLLKKILRERRLAGIYIQKNVRRFFVRFSIRRVLKMMKRNYAILYYRIKMPKDSISIKSVKIIFEETKGTWVECRIYSMEFNKYLDCFILYIKKLDYAKRKYKFNFIVNNKVLVDMNFETCSSQDGKFNNILNLTLLKSKGYLSNIFEKNDFYGIYNRGRKLTMPTLNYPTLCLSKNKIESFVDDFRNFRKKKNENLVVSY